MKKNVITLLLTTAIVFGLASCNDKDKHHSIAIRSVETTSTLDLSKRTDWKFYVGSYAYNYSISGQTLKATPKSEGETYYAGSSYYGSYGAYGYESASNGNMAMLRTLFLSPEYHLPLIENVDKQPMDQLDQSTADKMLIGDALSSWYPTITSEHVSGVALTHEHCLVEYTFVDLPEGAETALTSEKHIIKPLVEEGVTKAILVSPDVNFITAKVGDKTYEVSVVKATASLKKDAAAYPTIRNQHFTFEVKYNKDETDANKVLTIQNVKATQWSKDK